MPYRWRIVALLFFLSVVNYLDRQALSVLAPTLEHRLGFGAVQYSYVVSAFLIAYVIGYLLCGPIVDRFGVRASVIGALAVWSVAGLLHALAGTWIALAACRFLLGLAESFNSPCCVKALGEWTPRRERGLSTAIFSNGNIFGAILAPPFVSFVALRFGWQWGFLATGAVGLVYLAVWTFCYHPPEVHPSLPAAERAYILRERGTSAGGARISVIAALRHPLCVGFLIARLFTDSLSYFFTFWLPAYLHSAHGFTLAMIGLFGWIPFLASDIGGPGGGALSDWLVRHGWNSVAARRRLLLVAACLTPISLLAVHVGSAALALGLIAVVLAAQSCWNANLLTLMSETFPRQHLGTYVSVASVGGSIGGIISTLAAGRIIRTFGYGPVFTGLGFVHLIAFSVLVYFLHRGSRLAAASA